MPLKATGSAPALTSLRRLLMLWMVFEKFIRYAGLAVGLMIFEKLIRYTGLAVGLKPSATECEARLRGRERSMYSKTISPRLRNAKPACAG